MTKEEAIETIKDICLTTEQLTRIEKALECLLSQPPLPSDLDEAAEEASQSAYSEPKAEGFAKRCFFKRGFKAGAEWMAGQGQTFEAHIDNGCAVASGVKLPFVLWNTYEDGDVLKVQIRKKQ